MSAPPEPIPFAPFSYVEFNSAARPQAPALLDAGRVITFRQLAQAVRQLAAVLAAEGVQRGEPVAVRLPNIWEYVALELAIPYLGAVIMPLHLGLGDSEIRSAMSRSGARRLITEADLPSLFGARSAEERAPLSPDPERVVEIALTSGTTGVAKLASLTAGLKQATFEGFARRLQVTSGDRVLIMTPLTQGIGGMCLYCLRVGAALIMLHEPRFSPEQVLRLASQTMATYLVGVPTNVIRLLQSEGLPGADLRRLRVTAVAGSPMPPEVAQLWEERTGAKVCIFYGSMDAGQLAVASPSDPPEKRWRSVGRPHDSCQVMICDQGGRALPAEEAGEICMRGPTVQERFWGEQAGPHDDDGWVHMGDLGYLDAEGYLHVVGRIKDIIIRGGTNISPFELESALRGHPGVLDVCIVGLPDPELGERVAAFVVASGPTLQLSELTEFLSAKGLARYKWPERLELIEEIPLKGPGKVDRLVLRDRLTSM